MVEKTEDEEEAAADQEKGGKGGGRFSLAPMSFEQVVDTLLGIKPEKPARKGRGAAPAEDRSSEGEGTALEEARPEE